jgi:hypothetical protein
MQINLIRYTPSVNLSSDGRQVHMVRYTASVSGTPAAPDAGIFIQRRMPDGSTRTEGVCALAQFRSLPVGSPSSSSPVFRADNAAFCGFSADEMQELHLDILAQASTLVADFNAAGTLTASEPIVVDGSGEFSSEDTGVIVTAGNFARVVFNSDRSALLAYDANGTLVAEIPLALP